jgi:branched-chain amino acid transport system substrate-binding protein
MRFVRRAFTGCLIAGAAIAIAACGSSSSSSSGTAGAGGSNAIDIYSDLPLKQAVSAQSIPTVNGEKLALAEAGYKAGKWKINFISMDDATATSPTAYDLNVCQSDARRAATDPKAVYLVGTFNSGCAEVELPILNQAGVAMVSPANTYVGLTTNDPGSAPGEPQKYYPTGKRTYLRIVPRDSVQGVSGLAAMKDAGCTRVGVANDKTPYGAGLAQQVVLNQKSFGITVTGNTALDPSAPNYRGYATTLKSQGVNCVYTGFNPNGEVELIKDVEAAIPSAKVFGGDGVCSAAITNPSKGGIPASVGPHFFCTVATRGLFSYPGGKTFAKAYSAKYGVAQTAIDPYAIYGYTDMKLALDTIAKLGSNGNSKSAVVAALFATKNYNSPIGTFSFDSNGDTTTKTYGLYKVGSDHNPTYEKSIQG